MYVEPSNVVRLLILTYGYLEEVRKPTVQEQELHDSIKNIIDQSVIDASFEFQTIHGLEFLNEHEPIAAQAVLDDEDEHLQTDTNEVTQEELEESCSANTEGGLIDEEYKRKAVEYWRSGKGKRLTMNNVQNRFKKVKSNKQLYRWERYLQKGGTKHDKLRTISEYVLNKFLASLNANLIVHDINIRI